NRCTVNRAFAKLKELENRRERMLYEVCAHLAVVETLSQTAQSEVEIWQYGSISLLNYELIEEGKTARERVVVSLITVRTFCDGQCGADGFEIDGGCVTWSVRLVIVDEGARLVLLISE